MKARYIIIYVSDSFLSYNHLSATLYLEKIPLYTTRRPVKITEEQQIFPMFCTLWEDTCQTKVKIKTVP